MWFSYLNWRIINVYKKSLLRWDIDSLYMEYKKHNKISPYCAGIYFQLDAMSETIWKKVACFKGAWVSKKFLTEFDELSYDFYYHFILEFMQKKTYTCTFMSSFFARAHAIFE